MRKTLGLLALLSLTACAVPLTGDQAADCLNARNQVIQDQGYVSAANSALAVATASGQSDSRIATLQALAAVAQTNLDDAKALAADLCTPRVAILPGV